nr:MAG TPA: hypothetical protein [Caudoviricetes sp.]
MFFCAIITSSGVCVPSRFNGPTGRQSVRRFGRM